MLPIVYQLSLLATCLVNIAAASQFIHPAIPIQNVFSGHITSDQVFSFIYIPFEVPPGVTSIYVLQSYTEKGAGNALDLGVFDQRGVEIMDALNGTSGSRGWSGGFRNNFTITPGGATPGYNAGPIEPGIWNVVLGPYSSTPRGINWTLEIELDFEPVTSYFSAAYSPISLGQFPITIGEDIWLRGDFHLHSVYSDGRYTPDQQIANAVQRKLDFIFFTEHNTDSGNQIYGAYSSIAPNLLICRGIEVTTRHGHWQALGLERGQKIEWRYHPGDNPGFEAATQQVHKASGLVSVNHPFQTCSRCDWGFDYDHNDAIEVWNGQWDDTDQKTIVKWQELLTSGKRIVAIGGSDTHSYPDIIGLPTTVVYSRGRSQAAIVDAVKRGHAYLVKKPEMSLQFSAFVKGVEIQIGSRIKSNSSITFRLQTISMQGHTACFVSEKGYIYNETITANEIIERRIDKLSFVRVEIRNVTDSMIGLTNPIYIEPSLES